MIKQQLQQLEQDTDLETVLEVINLFMQSAPSQLEKMHLLQKTGEGKELSAIAHAMKGNMAYLGSKQGWEQCAKIELRCANGSTSDITDDLTGLTTQLEQMFLYLEQVIESGEV